jgi:AmmeMemoRadiSam system protein B
MHTPYIYKRMKQTFGTPDKFPPIVPILIGDNDREQEKEVGRVLVPYLKDTENAFVISSDFCHWGSNFSYMVYAPEGDWRHLKNLRAHHPTPAGPPIHETIRLIDEAAMDAVKSGSHNEFVGNLAVTGNTVCGRHPIGVTMAALEYIRQETGSTGEEGKFKVVQYQRSNLVKTPSDMSVSYVSAYAVL